MEESSLAYETDSEDSEFENDLAYSQYSCISISLQKVPELNLKQE